MKTKIRIEGREYRIKNYINLDDVKIVNPEEAVKMVRQGYDKKMYLVDSETKQRVRVYSSSQGFSEPIPASMIEAKSILMINLLKEALSDMVASGELTVPNH